MKVNVNNKEQQLSEVFVVGSGWAGLSCAVRLKQKGASIQLFEATRQLGGRARCIKYKDHILDNGQHILLGACQETLNLFQLLGMKEDDYFYRLPLKLDLFPVNKELTNTPTADTQGLHIHPANLPAPLHLLFGFISAKNITYKDKAHLAKLFVILRWKNFQIPKAEDSNLLQLLQKHHQSESIIHKFWEPLCLAVMNTPIKIASAKIFFNVLKYSFIGKKSHSDLLLFSTLLCDSLPNNAFHFLKKGEIQNSPSTIYLNTPIDSLLIKNSAITGIKIKNQEFNCSRLVLSTPLHITRKLLEPHPECCSLVKSLQKIDYQPIYTIYLYYQGKFELPQYMTGILNGYSQWVFDKRFSQQNGLLAVIISGPGKHQKISRDELIKQVALELDTIFTLPKLNRGIVIKENRATINCSTANNKLRPCSQTPIKGLYLAGDYTDTGFPSTLEGAILSGRTAAELVIERDR